ncbi:MAG TPA: ATP-binding protein [Parafilimonas sp.]|nr:ATP-binding protein [Parafilimonas sp.]
MLLPGTQMYIVTFIFVCIEIVILFYLLIYRLARSDDRTTVLNIVLIFLLITYNVTGGLLPDPNLPGSFFIQETIAYATGFIVPCYFPYYVYKAFNLEKMKFHAFRGVFLFLMLPYFVFVIVFAKSNNLDAAKDLLILPVAYALWVITSLLYAIRHKYKNDFTTNEAKEELVVLLLSLSPWVGLPVIAYLNFSQGAEVTVTNSGFLLLFSLQVKRHIKNLRIEHERLIYSEQRLQNWNESLQREVNKRTKELEIANEQKTTTFVNLAHETKTPLTLINNYLEEYIHSHGRSEELTIIKKNIDKLSNDIVNFFDLERYNKGLSIYSHNQVCNISEILSDNLVLFKEYSKKKKIDFIINIERQLLIKADPVAINRIIINLIENAIKFSSAECSIEVFLERHIDNIIFSVKDCGIGIPLELQEKVFEPYYQIENKKESNQGMGLGLPIIKKIVDELNGKIEMESNPRKQPGTKVSVMLHRYRLQENEEIVSLVPVSSIQTELEEVLEEKGYDEKKDSILIIEDNVSMINYLSKKLNVNYNVYPAVNGSEAIKKLKNISIVPDLILSDVMMDKVDGFAFAKIISNDPVYNHIPIIFLTAKAEKSDRLQGLKLGAVDYVQKPFSINELVQKIESIVANTKRQRMALVNSAFKHISKAEALPAVQNQDSFELSAKLYNLSSREMEIAKLVCEGIKYKEIAERLFIAERTVTKHVQNIFEKVGVTNKVELINKLEN